MAWLWNDSGLIYDKEKYISIILLLIQKIEITLVQSQIFYDIVVNWNFFGIGLHLLQQLAIKW